MKLMKIPTNATPYVRLRSPERDATLECAMPSRVRGGTWGAGGLLNEKARKRQIDCVSTTPLEPLGGAVNAVAAETDQASRL